MGWKTISNSPAQPKNFLEKKNLLLALMLKKLFSSLTSPLTSHLFFFQSVFHRSSLVVGWQCSCREFFFISNSLRSGDLTATVGNYKGRWLFLLGSAEGILERLEARFGIYNMCGETILRSPPCGIWITTLRHCWCECYSYDAGVK